MQEADQPRQYTVRGVTFTLLKGRKEEKDLRTGLQELYPTLVEALAERAGTDPEGIRDSLHDILLQELEKDRRGIRDVKSYLKVAAFRRYRRSFRHEDRMVLLGNLLGDESAKLNEERPGRDLPAGDQAAAHELRRRAWAELEHLPLRQRYVLTMWCCGLTNGQIALELDLTPENVRFHKHAAIQSLRTRLGVRVEETA